jgi:hypothetical protein
MSNVSLELSLNATDTSVCLHQQGIIASDTLTFCAQMLTREGFIHRCQHLSEQLIMFSSVLYSTLRSVCDKTVTTYCTSLDGPNDELVITYM